MSFTIFLMRASYNYTTEVETVDVHTLTHSKDLLQTREADGAFTRLAADHEQLLRL